MFTREYQSYVEFWEPRWPRLENLGVSHLRYARNVEVKLIQPWITMSMYIYIYTQYIYIYIYMIYIYMIYIYILYIFHCSLHPFHLPIYYLHTALACQKRCGASIRKWSHKYLLVSKPTDCWLVVSDAFSFSIIIIITITGFLHILTTWTSKWVSDIHIVIVRPE